MRFTTKQVNMFEIQKYNFEKKRKEILNKDTNLSQAVKEFFEVEIGETDNYFRFRSKIAVLDAIANPSIKIPAHRVHRMIEVYDLYVELGTLQKVGEKMNLTRERVRQILAKGNKYGLFEYDRHKKKQDIYERMISISKANLVQAIKEERSRLKIVNKLGIDDSALGYLINKYDVDFEDVIHDARKDYYINQYKNIVDILGKHPTTTEMQRNRKWHSIQASITRIWGSFDIFRHEYGIERPSHRFNYNTVKTKSIKKENKINQVYELIKNRRFVTSRDVSRYLGFERQTATLYLQELQKRNLITKVGSGVNTEYEAI